MMAYKKRPGYLADIAMLSEEHLSTSEKMIRSATTDGDVWQEIVCETKNQRNLLRLILNFSSGSISLHRGNPVLAAILRIIHLA